MMRHLLTSTARTTSRSLFAKPNASAYMASHRTFSDKKQSTGQKPFYQEKSCFAAGLVGVAAGFALTTFAVKKGCRLTYLDVEKPEKSRPLSHASFQSAFKGAKVTCEIARPDIRFNSEGTDVRLPAVVNVHLPGFSDSSDFKQMCEGLKRRGINVECSEEGVRRGLGEYALKYLFDGVRHHVEKKCTCDHFSTSPKKPSLRDSSMDAATMTEFHGWLARRGIHVECSEQGVSRGIFEYSLGQMHADKHRKKMSSCEMVKAHF